MQTVQVSAKLQPSF